MSFAGPSRFKTAEGDTRMTSLLIKALETSPLKRHTVAELYQRLVELNPSLAQRSSDWQVRRSLTQRIPVRADNVARLLRRALSAIR